MYVIAKCGFCDGRISRERLLMNFILLILYIIIIFAWFIDTMHILLQLEGNVKVKINSREKNENKHSNTARAKFVNRT